MEYNTIVERIKARQYLSYSDISGSQLFMLMHDGYLKNIIDNRDKCTYEINIIPIDKPHLPLIEINDKNYPTSIQLLDFFERIVDRYKLGASNTWVRYDDEEFEIEVEVLETK